jgi:hypothetical protein
MSGDLPQMKRIELFRAYSERQAIQHVAGVCSVSPTTALRCERLHDWDGRLAGITRKADEKIDDSIAEMMARQGKQARAVQAKAFQKIVVDGFKATRAAADAYFKATQEERVIRGEPSDRLNVVHDQTMHVDRSYEVLKECLRDEESRRPSDRMLDLRWQAEQRCDGASSGNPGEPPLE